MDHQSGQTTATTTQQKMPLGKILQQAGLINQAQLELALQSQAINGYEDFRLGEILALRGWVKQETSDFFAARWEQIKAAVRIGAYKRKIGDYLYEAHLLTAEQIIEVLKHQRETELLFGQAAVAKGYVKPDTVNFFVEQLLSNHAAQPPENKIDEHIRRAKGYLVQQDHQGAILELREALKRDPNHGKCHALLAKIYTQQKQGAIAKVHFKKAMQVNPKDTIIQELSQQYQLEVAPVPASPKKGKTLLKFF